MHGRLSGNVGTTNDAHGAKPMDSAARAAYELNPESSDQSIPVASERNEVSYRWAIARGHGITASRAAGMNLS